MLPGAVLGNIVCSQSLCAVSVLRSIASVVDCQQVRESADRRPKEAACDGRLWHSFGGFTAGRCGHPVNEFYEIRSSLFHRMTISQQVYGFAQWVSIQSVAGFYQNFASIHRCSYSLQPAVTYAGCLMHSLPFFRTAVKLRNLSSQHHSICQLSLYT